MSGTSAHPSRGRARRGRHHGDWLERLEDRCLLSTVPTGLYTFRAPAGVWAYDARPAEAIAAPGEIDTIPLTIDRGQTLSIGLNPGSTLKARVDLISVDQGNIVVATASASGPGQQVLLPVVTAPGVSTANAAPLSFAVRVTGLDGTVGGYSTRITLNAALEAEGYGGLSNNTRAQAQNLDGGFTGPLKANEGVASTVQPLRAVALGALDAVPAIPEVEANQPPDLVFPEFDPAAVAQDLNGGRWSLDEVENINGSTELKHVTVNATGDGSYDYYKFTIPQAADPDNDLVEVQVDIDGANFDSEILVYIPEFGGFRDIGFPSLDLGDAIESAFYAVEFQGSPELTMIIVVGRPGSSFLPTEQPYGAPLLEGDTYSLHVSLTEHASNPEAADPIAEVEPNHPEGALPPPNPLLSYAQNLESSTWFNAPDPFVAGSATLPYVSIAATGDGTFDYYKFVVPAAGAQGVFDLDFGTFDGMMFLFDDAGNLLEVSDDDGGDPGSVSIRDPLINYTFSAPGTYVIAVASFFSSVFNGQLVGEPVPEGDSYTLHVGVGGHSAVGFESLDYYKVTLRAGDRFTAVATPAPGAAPEAAQLELVAADGSPLASGSPSATNFGDAIRDWLVPATGTYYARVLGLPRTEYSLVAVRNAALDAEGNNSISTAQAVVVPSTNGALWAFGAIGRRDIVLNAFDSGWYNEAGFHGPTNTNYFAGYLPPAQFPLPPNGELRNFFAFNVPTFSEPVLGARLRVGNPSGAFASNEASETYALYDVGTPVGQLVAGGSGLTGIFNDLGTGVSYASRTFTAADNGQTIEIGLSPAALADLSARQGGQFALGGALTTIDRAGPLQRVFGFSNASFTRQVVLSLSESDFYRVTLAGGAGVTIETMTPGGAGGAFENTLDPLLRVYDAAGVLVASNDNGAADGRNARMKLSIPPSAGGTYFVEVTFAPGTVTAGEYALKMSGASASTIEEPKAARGMAAAFATPPASAVDLPLGREASSADRDVLFENVGGLRRPTLRAKAMKRRI